MIFARFLFIIIFITILNTTDHLITTNHLWFATCKEEKVNSFDKFM